GLVQHVYFANERVLTEGQASTCAAFLQDGEVMVEVAGRGVRREEVPGVEMLLTLEASDASATNLADAEVLKSPRLSVRRNSRSARPSLRSLLPTLDAGKEAHSLITMTNRARAEAMMAEAVQDGLVPGYEVESLPELAPFGEECLLGITDTAGATVRVCKL
ncbi:unnamed protein product, partial [Effrenium voratum]